MTELSKTKRLILANQYEILSILDPRSARFYNDRARALRDGYTRFYPVDEFIADELPDTEQELVIQILDLYRALTFSYQALEETEEVARPQFVGFDGNDERECELLGFADYLINQLRRFRELSPDGELDLNSHREMLQTYQVQLERWAKLGRPMELSLGEIREILALD